MNKKYKIYDNINSYLFNYIIDLHFFKLQLSIYYYVYELHYLYWMLLKLQMYSANCSRLFHRTNVLLKCNRDPSRTIFYKETKQYTNFD